MHVKKTDRTRRIAEILNSCSIPSKRFAEARALYESMEDRIIRYPWKDLEEISNNGFDLIGYGSLLHPCSARMTIQDTPHGGHPPVLAWGLKRVFNYSIPQDVFDKYGEIPQLNERAALNTEPADWEQGAINGRLIHVRLNDIKALREREKGYDLVSVVCLSWENPEAPAFIGYALSCMSTIYEGIRIVDDALQPYPPYFEICRSGAEKVGKEFLELFLLTTFLADRLTDMEDWMQARNRNKTSSDA